LTIPVKRDGVNRKAEGVSQKKNAKNGPNRLRHQGTRKGWRYHNGFGAKSREKQVKKGG